MHGRFIEIKNNLKRKKLHRMNQNSTLLGGSFSNKDSVRAPVQFRSISIPFILSKGLFLTYIFNSMYIALTKLSEYTYF